MSLHAATHLAWLDDQFRKVIAFSLASLRPDGGFHWLDETGTPRPGVSPQLFLTARMTYAGACGTVLGIPGAQTLMDHGVSSLLNLHADSDHGGWLTDPTQASGRKMTYDHVHVGFAAANAVVAGNQQASELLDQAIDIIDTRLWREGERALAESFAADWSDEEDYRGANSNMHGVEAFLAIGVATGERRWFERARDMADRIVNQAARTNDWLLPEHFTRDWQPVLDYNRDQPKHPFRPYGWTPGHAFEWSRLLLELAVALGDDAPAWLLECSRAFTDKARAAWAIDGTPGFAYTTDWDLTVIEGSRLHWPLCEAIQASAVLAQHTGETAYLQDYRAYWEHAAVHFVDGSGMWANELTAHLEPAGTVWPGRPDVYHTIGALLTPSVAAHPCLAKALSQR